MNSLIVLASLLSGPRHGYRLKREAGLIFGERALHNNLIYPMLRRFVAQGWVNPRRAPGERGQTRTLYALTARGRQALQRQAAAFGEEQARSAPEFLTRAALFELLPPAARENILSVREQWLRARSQRLKRLAAAMELGAYGGEIVKFLLRQAAAELAWLRRLRRLAPGERSRRRS